MALPMNLKHRKAGTLEPKAFSFMHGRWDYIWLALMALAAVVVVIQHVRCHCWSKAAIATLSLTVIAHYCFTNKTRRPQG